MATINAIEKRIRRKLAQDGQVLRKARNERVRFDLGGYYVTDVRTGGADYTHVDLESLARELGVIRPHEHMA